MDFTSSLLLFCREFIKLKSEILWHMWNINDNEFFNATCKCIKILKGKSLF